MEKYKSRSEVPEKYKWDLTDIFKDLNDFNNSFEVVKNDIDKLKDYVNCTKSPDELLKYIEFSNDLGSRLLSLVIYAMLTNDQDLNDNLGVELIGKVSTLETDYSINTSFFEPELLSLNKKEYEDLFSNKNLLKYKSILDDIYRYKDHILSEDKEKIVSQLTNVTENYSQMSSTLMNACNDYGFVKLKNGETEELMPTNYRRIMKQLDREDRKKVYEQFNKVKDRYASISASLLDSYVKTNVSLSKIYNYKSTWDKHLFDLKLSDKVYDSLVKAALDKKDIYKKYFDLKSKILNVDKCLPWDNPIELFETEEKYTIEDAGKIIKEALKPLGEDYINHFNHVIDDRCVDYCQYKGKHAGGYNVSSESIKNSKILMSFNYDLESISTLAHESGHHVHHQYLFENNIDVYRNVSVSVAEVASLTNEFLLSYYLVKNGKREEALAGLSNIIGTFESNFFGAIWEADMEREFYKYVEKGGTLTKEYLYNLTEKMLLKYFPKEKLDSEYEKNQWTLRSHYYNFYYMFSYAICVSVASYVSKEIINKNDNMLEKYMKFLKTGSNVDIMDIFKVLGVNIEDEKVYIEAINNFDSLLNEFDRLYNE